MVYIRETEWHRVTNLALIVNSRRATQIAVVISLLERRKDLISQHGIGFDGMPVFRLRALLVKLLDDSVAFAKQGGLVFDCLFNCRLVGDLHARLPGVIRDVSVVEC
jgi:hypothetical protein